MEPIPRVLSVCSLMWAVGAHALSPVAREPLPYGPERIEVIGTIYKQTFPGPPTYGEAASGDTAETAVILKLDHPVDVRGDDRSDWDEPEQGLTEMQMVYEGDWAYRVYRGNVGRKVIVTGTLFHSFTAHHRTEVLIWVEKVSLVETAGPPPLQPAR